MQTLCRLLWLVSLAIAVSSLNNGVGLTPAMGWNSWNDVQTNISESVVLSRAQALVDSGLAALGFVYVNIDDGLVVSRNAKTMELEVDPEKFPSGLSALAEKLHKMGLKFGSDLVAFSGDAGAGVYTDRGNKTCAGRPGSLGYENLDAQTFAGWGVDYVKEDNCHAPGGPNDKEAALAEFGKMRDALNATGRPIWFAVCGGGGEIPFLSNISWFAVPPFGRELGNSWRVTADVGAPLGLSWATARSAMKVDGGLSQFAGPGGWNDADMLLTSHAHTYRHLTETQSRTQFAVWCILASPLIIGGPVNTLSSHDLATYSNADLIAVNQDPKGEQGQPLTTHGLEQTVWGRSLSDGGVAMVFVNEGVLEAKVECDTACWDKTHLSKGTLVQVVDLWAHRVVGNVTVPGTLAPSVAPHGAHVAYKLSPV